ncbi:MAG: nuclear transport factor 2 family protein [Deltaproteobacteria bacterium]|nr:nuclear transport factor 2 family protein [Deltaproteobacteria bacterium]
MDQREADAMLRADLSALALIWDEKLIAYSTANLYAGKQVLLDYIKKGGLRLKSHKRRTVKVVFDGGEAISIGLEDSELDNPGAGTRVLCSYMNVWTKRAGGWRLRARYVGRVSGSRANAASKK